MQIFNELSFLMTGLFMLLFQWAEDFALVLTMFIAIRGKFMYLNGDSGSFHCTF